MSKKLRKYIRLRLEELEPRCVPAYLVYSPQDFTVKSTNDNSVVEGFQLRASVVTTSDRYGSPDGAHWQAVASSPTTFSEILGPTSAESNVLQEDFPNATWQFSNVSLADGSLIIADAEAVGTSRRSPSLPQKVGQSLFIKYNPTGLDPDPASIHWLQMVTTNVPTGVNQAGVPYPDTPSETTPWYDDGPTPANGTGFADVPNRDPRDIRMYWHADLFLVQMLPNGSGGTNWRVWQGVSWGWQAGDWPLVSGIAPNVGPTTGNNVVRINGYGFTGTTGVTFGNSPALVFNVNDDSSITALAPVGVAGTVDVQVTTPIGVSYLNYSDQYFYLVLPNIMAVAPNSGSIAGGYAVTISGSGFTGATRVALGGVAASSFTVNSDTSITAIVPAESAGTVDVTVTTAGGTSATSSSDQFTFIAPPTISINNVTQSGSSSGTSQFIFTVSLSAASSQTITVNFATADGTAIAGSDYYATSGTLTFNPGQTSLTITVTVIGDPMPDPNEIFYVNLSNATNASLANAQGIGTITGH
jgi:hypothetical protein